MSLPPQSFPCSFPIKAVGKNTPEFQAAVIKIIRKHVPDLGEGAISQRPSKDKNYMGMTFLINAISQEQLDSIYQDLSDSPEVLVAL